MTGVTQEWIDKVTKAYIELYELKEGVDYDKPKVYNQKKKTSSKSENKN